MGNDGFTMKEMILIVMEDLKDFRVKYDEDQAKRDIEISKRPTWAQMTGLVGGAGVLVTIAVTLTGG
ncbi:hypothetical protein LCGC14_2594670 [marine sediment metagenome]|uniref:Uncharacterized protein n=1 Tax=marine sediment metagenome TaxID=412755 RepID=A0A0F9D383_9ZZZZ